MKNSIKLPCTL